MSEAVIVSTARSPIGRAFKGSLKDERPDDLAAAMVTAALAKHPAFDAADPGQGLDDLYLGCAEPSGEAGSNMARVVAILAGLDNVPAATINRFCASSLQTLRMAFHAIKAGEGQAFVAAGVEAVSRYRDWAGAGETDAGTHNPLFDAARQRTAARAASNTPWTDPRLGGRMPDIYIAMGQTAENVATSYGISRAEQDAWAVLSQNRAEAAIAPASTPGRSRRTPGRTAPWWTGTIRPGQESPWTPSAPCSRCSAARAPSPPATPAR